MISLLPVLKDDDSDELDEEFEKLKNANIKSRRLKVMEEIQLAEGALQDSKLALKKSEEQVSETVVLGRPNVTESEGAVTSGTLPYKLISNRER